MLRVNQARLYDLGAAIHPFETSVEGKKYQEVFLDIWNARNALFGFINDQLMPVKICKPSALAVISAMTDIVPWEADKAIAAEGEAVITWIQANALVNAVKAFETVMAAEMQALDTYFVSQKGAYSTYDLIEQAHLAIPEALRPQLPEDAVLDFDKAGRCLAFDLATAAGFHLVRATESVLRKYYFQVTGVMPKVKDRNWGAFIKNLKKCVDAAPKIIHMLEELKDDYRNPILHPDESLTSAQALVMFTIFTGAAVALLEETDRLAKKSPSLPFAQELGSGLANYIGSLTGITPSLALPNPEQPSE